MPMKGWPPEMFKIWSRKGGKRRVRSGRGHFWDQPEGHAAITKRWLGAKVQEREAKREEKEWWARIHGIPPDEDEG